MGEKEGEDAGAERNDICRSAHMVICRVKRYTDAVDPEYTDKDRPVLQRLEICLGYLILNLLELIFIGSGIQYIVFKSLGKAPIDTAFSIFIKSPFKL